MIICGTLGASKFRLHTKKQLGKSTKRLNVCRRFFQLFSEVDTVSKKASDLRCNEIGDKNSIYILNCSVC